MAQIIFFLIKEGAYIKKNNYNFIILCRETRINFELGLFQGFIYLKIGIKRKLKEAKVKSDIFV